MALAYVLRGGKTRARLVIEWSTACCRAHKVAVVRWRGGYSGIHGYCQARNLEFTLAEVTWETTASRLSAGQDGNSSFSVGAHLRLC
eukprot:scaffold355580_cov41-Prasinocladus_malaysianus.AAC.2